MYVATCFDSNTSSSGHSMNHNIDISSDSAHFGIPKCALSLDISTLWFSEYPDDDALESKHVATYIIDKKRTVAFD